MPGSTKKGTVNNRYSSRLVNTGQNNPDHEGYDTIKLPITYITTTLKLLSGIVTIKLNRHMTQYTSTAQKSTGNNTRGSKYQLLVDRAVHQDSKTRWTNLSTAWFDYKNAYDSILHTWIPEWLALFKGNSALITFIGISVELWKTLEVNAKSHHHQVWNIPR